MGVARFALYGLVAACLVCSAVGNLEMPKFVKIDPSVKVVSALDVTAPQKPSNWYAAWPTGLQLTLTGRQAIENFRLECYVNPLNKESQLSEIRFCFDDNCETLTDEGKFPKRFKDEARKNWRVKLSFSKVNGGYAVFESVSNDDKLNTKFYCSVTNKMGTLRSNTLKILDYRQRFPANTWLVSTEPAKPLVKSAPYTFQCLKNNANPPKGAPPYFVKWAYCSNAGVIEPKLCSTEDLLSLIKSNNWPAHIRSNGDLYVPYFSNSVANQLQGRMLLCILNQVSVTYYQKPLSFSDEPSALEIKALSMIRPKNLEKVSLLNSKAVTLYLPCNFQVGPGTYEVNWQYTPKGESAARSIGNTRNENGVSVSNVLYPNGIEFKGPFTDKTTGKYTCTVAWYPKGGRSVQKISGSYDVEVLFYPSVSKKMVPLKYVADGNNGTVKCLFEGLKVKPSLSVNGVQVDLKSKHSIDQSIRTVNMKFNKVMAGLKVTVAPINPNPGAIVEYTAKGMAYRSSMGNLPSSHMVECIGTNEVGSVRWNTFLKVVPRPALVPGREPSSLNCSECSATEAHTIHCQVSNKDEIKKNGVVFKQYWMLGNQRVDDILAPKDAPARKYLVVSPEADSLTIKKIDDKEFKDTVNSLKTVECVLTLGYPASTVKYPSDVPSSDVEKGLFFISSHTDMQKALTTPIKLTNIAPPTLKTGSMMWVIPVILALIVILIIIGATYYCCRQRKSGEEYNVDAKEKQQGNDPEVEVAEKEAFPVFERPEDGPIRGSRASLDDSIHVGSDDEDEVLAEYDVDIGKFDEEGSFIGQYAVNDGAGTGNRRLPQVGNNTEV